MPAIPIADLKRSLVLAWALASVPVALSAAAPFVIPGETISRVAPVCQSKARHGRPCAGCGLTRSFVALGRGDWQGAVEANTAGIPVFALFSANTLALIGYAASRLRR